DLHRKKFKVNEIVEQSQWLLLSPKIESNTAIAQISNLKIEHLDNNMKSSRNDFFSFLENKEKNYAFKTKNLSFVSTKPK
ncbi:hypothetical protein MNBD_BACTEROID04-530, partial [hydrothermal vent metagenome]